MDWNLTCFTSSAEDILQRAAQGDTEEDICGVGGWRREIMRNILLTVGIVLALLGSGYALIIIDMNSRVLRVFEPRFIHFEGKDITKIDQATLSKALNNLIKQYEESEQLWKDALFIRELMIYMLITLMFIEVVLVIILWRKTRNNSFSWK